MIVYCKHCEGQASDAAIACPQCGHPLREAAIPIATLSGKPRWIIAGVLGSAAIVVFGYIATRDISVPLIASPGSAVHPLDAQVTDKQQRDRLAMSIFEDRFALLEWVFDPEWAAHNPDRAAGLRDEGIPLWHYRNVWRAVINLSSGAANGYEVPLPVKDLPMYFMGLKTFTRHGHEAISESIWKFRLAADARSTLIIRDDDGPCTRRVFTAMDDEWTDGALWFMDPAGSQLLMAGTLAIDDVADKYFGSSEKSEHTTGVGFEASRSTDFYTITVWARTSKKYDDWGNQDGHTCFGHLSLELRPQPEP